MFIENFVVKRSVAKSAAFTSLSGGYKIGVEQECKKCKIDFLRNKEEYTKDGEDGYEKNKCWASN